ncbi:hypothetical protein BKA70DRAFT_732288 [Coprinopsis sp. MPI-PUGE-AT-0042]|nr:hypothetical protein BKA70DRAFT_732288 [Coprinopsis sp. MPI-PUGE-AT-0042]
MSQIQATASTGSSKQAKVRTTWRTFEGWLAQGKRTLNTQQSQADNDAAKDYKTLSSVEKAKTSLKQYKTNKRAELEKAFYAKAREEWQDRLRKAGLKDEDWGTMTEAERKSVEKGLGAHLAAEAEKNGSVESTATTASAVQEAASASSMALVTSSGLLSAPKMFPSVSTSSVSSYASAASYEFVKPSELGSDDDGDDDPSETFNHATAALASEDDGELEVLSTNWRTFDGMPATSSSSSSAYAHHVPQYSTQQQQYGARPSIATHNTWTSSAESSRHTSASGSPTTSSSGLRNFPNLTSPGSFQAMLSPNTVTQPDAYSHSRLFEPSYTSASSVAAGSASASSSASARRPKLLHAATTASNVSVNTNVWTPPGVTSPTATLPPAISASSSASAAAAGALVKPKSSPSSSVSSTASTSTHTSVSTSTSASSYIGPILLEPSDTEDNNLDLDILTNVKSKPKTKDFDPAKLLSPEEAEQEAVDFERFKFETRITKIIEFHRIAAEREVRLGLEIMKMRLRDSSSSSTSDGTSGKDAEPSTALVKFSGSKNSGGKAIRDEERKRVAEHEEAMRRLQQEKEDERKLLVREERKRRRAALQLRLELGEKPVLSNGDRTSRETLNNPTWLDQYDTVQAVFDVPIPNGELEGVFGNGKRARSATITQSNSSPQPPQPQPQAQAPQQRVQSRGGGGGPTKPYPRAHSTKPYRPPPSPDVPIARPRPLPAAWGQIPFMQEEGAQEEDGEEDGEEEEGDEYEYEYEYEWQYDGDPSQAGYPPPHAGQPPSFHPEQQQQHGQQVYHPQQQVQHAHSPPQHQRQVHGQETFMPRMYDNEDHHSQHQLQQQHHQQQQQQQPNQFDNAYSPFPPRFGNYDEEVQLEIQRAMEQLTATPASSSSSFSNGGYGFGTNPSSSSVSDMGGYMSDTLGAYGQGGNGGRPGSGSPSEHGYATDSRYHGHQGHQASAHSHHMHQQQQQHHQHGGSMPISMANSTSSSASGMSIPMPGGGIGMSPLEVSTPRVGSNGHPWGSQQGAPGGNGGFGMMSKTPTKNSPLATRGGNMFGQAGGQQQQQQHQQQNQQQQQQGQQTMMGGWGRKNSMINTAMDESPAHSPNMGTATANPNNANNANTNGASTLTSGLSWAAKKFSLFGGSGSTPAPTAETSMDSKLPLDEDQDDDDDEEDEEEEEEEEVTPPPPPPPPAKARRAGRILLLLLLPNHHLHRLLRRLSRGRRGKERLSLLSLRKRSQ